MYDTVCNFPLSADLFTQAIHPNKPIVAVGLASGHVASLALPPLASVEGGYKQKPNSPHSALNGFGTIGTIWRTRRHRGSCRALAYNLDGTALFSAGTDGLVKIAESETGRVTDKIMTPASSSEEIDAPSLIHVLSPQTCLLATDSSALHLYDLREGGTLSKARKPQQTHYPHNDYISSLTPLPPSETSTSGFSKQWVTTGGTTLSVTDLRRGVLVRSEDQEEELLSSCYASKLSTKTGGTSVGEKVVVGGGGGVLTLWEKGVWDDQDERIILDRAAEGGGGESIDVLHMTPEDSPGQGSKVLAAGLGNGFIHFVNLANNKVVGSVAHEAMDGVVGLGFDCGGRMISGGGSIIKVWHKKVDGNEDDDEDDEDSSSIDSSEVGSDQESAATSNGADSDEESEPEQPAPKKKPKRSQLPGGGTFEFTGLD